MSLAQEDPLYAQTGLDHEERHIRAQLAANALWGGVQDRTARTANSDPKSIRRLGVRSSSARLISFLGVNHGGSGRCQKSK
jgi:hypothetical protein